MHNADLYISSARAQPLRLASASQSSLEDATWAAASWSAASVSSSAACPDCPSCCSHSNRKHQSSSEEATCAAASWSASMSSSARLRELPWLPIVRLCDPRAALAECLNTRSRPSLVPYAMPPPCTVQHGKHQNLCQDPKSGPGPPASLQGHMLLFTHSKSPFAAIPKLPGCPPCGLLP